jgi:6,7-dimethyl-8-ribityllumazine synthase
MSSALTPKPRIVGAKTRVCIVASKYNEQFAEALVENAVEELGELLPHARIDLVRVPGAFEIPATIELVFSRDLPSVVIALGVIIRGATSHADLVATSVTEALQQLAIDHRKPIIHEVLLVEDEKQAYARCIGTKLNRGREAARAAAAMVEVFQEIERIPPRNA